MMLAPLLALHLVQGVALSPPRQLTAVARAVVDAGHEVVDAGHVVDAGEEDAGPPPIVDAGPPPTPFDAGPVVDAGGIANAGSGDQMGDANEIPTSCATADDCPEYWTCISQKCQPASTGRTHAATFGCSSSGLGGLAFVALVVVGTAARRRRIRPGD